MTRIEIQAKIDLFRRELRMLESIKINCGTCKHGERAGYCTKFQASPPDDVKSAGCDEYEHDGIPF